MIVLEKDLHAIGLRLLQYRKMLGMTQADVAEKTELSDRAYANIERGCVNMRLDTLLRICDVLGITPNDILVREEEPAILDEEELIGKLKSYTGTYKETALQLLQIYLNSISR